uniref:Uncharacterized protein n=1 Tax=mine drainage metagenome TaxID=410659 RepID=E6Q6L3_9ZZZZ
MAREIKNFALATAVCLALSTHLAIGQTQTPVPSATAYYKAAIVAMQRLPEPVDLTYTTHFVNSGIHFGLFHAADHKVGLGFTIAPGVAANGSVSYKTWTSLPAGSTLAVSASGKRYLSHSPLFVPTWSGVFNLIRYGWSGPPRVNAPATAAAASLPVGMKTIAVVSAIGTGAYRVEDRGAAICPGGAPGHALHLVPIFDPAEHHLSDVVIDTNNMRFCSMRFGINASIVALGVIGYLDVHFASAGKYWLVHDTHMVLSLRSFGIQLKHGATTISYPKMKFTTSFPRDLFVDAEAKGREF